MAKPSAKRASKSKRPANRRATVHAAQEATAATNRSRALELRIAGKSERAIATELGVSRSTAHEYIVAELAEGRDTSAENRERLRDIERARLERVLCHVFPFIENELLTIETQRGENVITVERFQAVVKGADMVVKISARLSALDGLDAPVKQEHSGTVNVEGLATIRARMAARKKV